MGKKHFRIHLCFEPLSTSALAMLIGGLGTAAGQTGSAIATAGRNRKQRKWQTEQYWLERQHMMEDWHRTNQYNSPQAQMQRFKEAGLSPHLMYGQGTGGNAGSPQSPSMGSPDIETPDIGSIGQGIGTTMQHYINNQQTEAATANMEKQTANIEAQTASTAMDVLMKKWELDKDQTYGQRKRAYEMLQSEADAILRSTTFDLEREHLESVYLANTNRNVSENWEAVMKNQLYSEEGNRELYKLMIKSGINASIASATMTQIDAEMKQLDLKYYMPNMVLGALQKVVGMIGAPIRSLFSKGQNPITHKAETGIDGKGQYYSRNTEYFRMKKK